MAQNCYEVDIFVINSEGTLTPKLPKCVHIRLDYDPEGLNIKIINGMLTALKQRFVLESVE